MYLNEFFMNSLLKFQNKVSVKTIYKCAILKVNTYFCNNYWFDVAGVCAQWGL